MASSMLLRCYASATGASFSSSGVASGCGSCSNTSSSSSSSHALSSSSRLHFASPPRASFSALGDTTTRKASHRAISNRQFDPLSGAWKNRAAFCPSPRKALHSPKDLRVTALSTNLQGACRRSMKAFLKRDQFLNGQLHFNKTMRTSVFREQTTCRHSNLLSIVAAVSATSPVEFPKDYDELLDQVRTATSAALGDSKMLMEIEFPTAGLDTVPGDAEGGIEMTSSMALVREFCRVFSGEKASRTRIFFPDIREVESARRSVFEGTSYKLDYLSKPSGLQDFGFGKKEKLANHVQSSDAVFVAAYPYFNVNEMIAVEELYKDSAEASRRPVIVFNGELDRIRSGYYPAFFYPKLGALAKNFLPKFETVYYIHNFKGRYSGTLFRAYPGPWQVLRKVNYKFVCIHEQEVMPTLKEVALNILPA